MKCKCLSVVLILTVLVQFNLAESGDKLWLSHALVEQGRIIAQTNTATHTAYVDVSHPFTSLRTLKTHASELVSHFDTGFTHLSSFTLYAMEHDGKYYAFGENVLTSDLSIGCALLGLDDVDLVTTAEFEAMADVISQFNSENNGTSIVNVDKIIVPALTKNGKLVSVETGRELAIGSSGLDLEKAKTVAPVFVIASKTFEYRTTDEHTQLLCRIKETSKRRYKGAWKTFLTRYKIQTNKLIDEIDSTVTELQSMFSSNTPFTYTSGVMKRIDELPGLQDLTVLARELPSHSVVNFDSAGPYALANLFLTRYILAIQDHLEQIQLEFYSLTQVSDNIVKVAFQEIAAYVQSRLQGVLNTQPYLTALQQSIKIAEQFYDTNQKVVMVHISYYQPQVDDLRTIFNVVPIPLQTVNYEIIFDLPSAHIATDDGNQKCQFLGHDFLLANCQRLNNLAGMYTCVSDILTDKDECCEDLVTFKVENALQSCRSNLYTDPSYIFRIDYRKINYILVTSVTQPQTFYIQCDGINTEYVTNETTTISTPCDVVYAMTRP